MVLMEQPSYLMQKVFNPVCVVSPQFMVQYPVDLMIVRELSPLSDKTFGVTDVNGNFIFKVKGQLLSIRDKRILVDVVGNRILTFQKKLVSARNRWQCFRGDSTDPRDLLFGARQSSLIQFKTSLDVFLAHNTKEDVCDFKVRGNWFDRCCTVYAGENTGIIAQMHTGVAFGKDTFAVTVYPNVDYAFIVALVVILSDDN